MEWPFEKISGTMKRGKPGAAVGAVNKQLFPLGSRLSAGERNTMIQNCPRKALSGVSLCLDYNAHSGCVRGATCNFVHDYFGGENLHWCVESELLRRGGFRKRKKMLTDAVEINALINGLRGKNVKIRGEQNTQWEERAGDKDTDLVVGEKILEVAAISSVILDQLSVPVCRKSEVKTPVDKMDWEVEDSWRRHIEKLANKNSPCAHGDFFHFDFTEAGNIGRDLIFSNQDWMYPDIPAGRKLIPMSALTDLQQQIAVWWRERSRVWILQSNLLF